MNTQIIITKTQIWLQEVVIGLNLCPFAARPFRKKSIRFVVEEKNKKKELLATLKREMHLLSNTPSSEIETTLLILSQAFSNFLEFNDFLYKANESLTEEGFEGELQLASFHPHYQFAATKEEDLENYTNRAPFPILHLLREESIEAALESYQNPDQIYLNNIKTMEALGAEGIKQLWKKFSKE